MKKTKGFCQQHSYPKEWLTEILQTERAGFKKKKKSVLKHQE